MPRVLTWNCCREWLTGGPSTSCARSRLLGQLGKPCRVTSGPPEEDPASKQGALAGEAPQRAALRTWRCLEPPLESGSQGHFGSEDAEGPQRVCRKFQKNLETCWAYRHTHTQTFSRGFISSDVCKKPRILNAQVHRILTTNTQAPSPGQRAWACVQHTTWRPCNLVHLLRLERNYPPRWCSDRHKDPLSTGKNTAILTPMFRIRRNDWQARFSVDFTICSSYISSCLIRLLADQKSHNDGLC